MKPITTLNDEIVQTTWPGPVTTRLRPVICRVDAGGRLFARWKGPDGYVGEEQIFPADSTAVWAWELEQPDPLFDPRFGLVGKGPGAAIITDDAETP